MSLDVNMTRAAWLILVGDVVALIAFGIVGILSHEDSFSAKIVGRSIVPFIVLWLITAPFIGVLVPNVSRVELLKAWTIAGVTALVARSIFFDRPFVSAFFVIAFVGNFLFLLAWRTVYDSVLARRVSTRP